MVQKHTRAGRLLRLILGTSIENRSKWHYPITRIRQPWQNCFRLLKFWKLRLKCQKPKHYLLTPHPFIPSIPINPNRYCEDTSFCLSLSWFSMPIGVTLTSNYFIMSVYVRFLLLVLTLFFKGEISAQVVFVDSVNLTNGTSGLKLWYLGENKYLLSGNQQSNDTLAMDSCQLGITLDSVLLQIQEIREKQSIKMTSKDQFLLVLCLTNTQFEMIEMQKLFEKLSEMEIRIKVELPIKN